MKDELTVIKKNELMEAIDDLPLGEVIRPLVKEVHLFDTFIAGTSHLEKKEVLDNVKEGDTLLLRRENNKFDENAIVILNEKNEKLGYIPEKDNVIFSRLMDAGKLLKGKVDSMNHKKDFYKIRIGVYLVDY